MVDARTVRQKLSKQLRIDLQPHEKVHLLAQPLGTLMATMTTDTSSTVDNEDATTTTTTTTTTAAAPFLSEEEELTALLQKIHSTREQGQACNVQIRQLGDYLASISLRGGHVIPLKVAILKR